MTRLLGLLVFVSGPVAIAMTATPASAGKAPMLTVTKVVDGIAPGRSVRGRHHLRWRRTATPNQLTFTGPGSDFAAIDSGSTTCTVVETENAAAAVSYACEITDDPGGNSDCSSGQAVEIAGGGVQTTITVTNTFVSPSTPPPSEQPAPAAAVVARPPSPADGLRRRVTPRSPSRRANRTAAFWEQLGLRGSG